MNAPNGSDVIVVRKKGGFGWVRARPLLATPARVVDTASDGRAVPALRTKPAQASSHGK